MDAQGDIIGVSVVEARRRGRIFTSAPKGMRDMLARAGSSHMYKVDSHLKINIDVDQFPEVGRNLRQSLSVSKVVCWVN